MGHGWDIPFLSYRTEGNYLSLVGVRPHGTHRTPYLSGCVKDLTPFGDFRPLQGGFLGALPESFADLEEVSELLQIP